MVNGINRSFLIGITGGSGSGKTTLVQRLRSAFSERDLCVVSQDDYYRPIQEQQLDENGEVNFDLPESFDYEAFHEDIQKLTAGIPVERPEYTFNNAGKNAGIKRLAPAPILVVEGIFIFHYPRIRNLFNLKIFVHAHENLKIIRRIRRDGLERGYDLNTVMYQYEKHVMPSFQKYIEPYREEADLILNNNMNLDKGINVVVGFLESKLKAFNKTI